MGVMDKNQINFLDDLFKFGSETVIDLEISAKIPTCELGALQPVMQDWPQHPIGRAAVVFLKAFLGKIGNHIFDVIVSNRAGLQLITGRDLAAPPQPDAAVVLERWPQCNFQTASAVGTVA